jgi:hypothetical protein
VREDITGGVGVVVGEFKEGVAVVEEAVTEVVAVVV